MNKNVPKLRFKEFSDEWKFLKLKEITEEIKRTTEEKIDNILTISAGNGFLNQKDRFSQVIAGSSLKKYTLLYEGEFSYNRGNSKSFRYGCIYKLKGYERALVPNVYISFKFINQNEEFYQQLFLKKYLDKYLRKLISSSARMDGLLNINKNNFFEIKVPTPSLQEQEKIANFFTILDSLIEEQEGKVRDLEIYKKGMMQKIFKQEIRFKDENGLDYPEWEEKMVCEFGDIITGTTPPKSNLDYYYNGVESKFTWITPTDIKQNKNIYEGAISLTKKGYNTCRKLPVNTVLVTCIASIGKNAILKSVGSCNQQINAIITNKENYYEFIYYLMEYSSCTLKRFAGITATPILNKTDFSRLIFNVPCLEEQIKIANFLSNIDNLIEEEQKNLDDLREVKKGLLQQMFV